MSYRLVGAYINMKEKPENMFQYILLAKPLMISQGKEIYI